MYRKDLVNTSYLLIELHLTVQRLQERFLDTNKDTIRLEYFPVGSPEFNAVEECWRQGKYYILSNYYSNFKNLKYTITRYYRTKRFQLDITKYLLRSMNFSSDF